LLKVYVNKSVARTCFVVRCIYFRKFDRICWLSVQTSNLGMSRDQVTWQVQ